LAGTQLGAEPLTPEGVFTGAGLPGGSLLIVAISGLLSSERVGALGLTLTR
jgi:hypothetical protein